MPSPCRLELSGGKCASSATFLLLVLLFSHAESITGITDKGQIIQVVGVAGRRVDLPCDISTGHPDDQAVLVLWYKNDDGTPIYNFDARDDNDDGMFSSRGTGGGRDPGSRRGGGVVFVTRTHPPALRMEALGRQDAGVYRCRVDFKYSPTRNQRVNLTVIIPPEMPTILYKNRPVAGVIGPLEEGQSLEVSCISREGRPVPRVWWYKDNRLLDDSDRAEPDGQVVNVLRLPPLGREDLNTRLSCSASNNNISQPVIAEVVIEMNFRPLVVEILGSSRTSMGVGKQYDLVCRTFGSRPPANISWWLDGKQLTGQKQTVSDRGNITTSTLAFRPGTADDNKQLVCRAVNERLTVGQLTEDVRPLNVRYSPIVSLKLGYALDPNNIKEGADVYFDCKIRANPNIYSVIWTHNGMPLDPSPRSGESDVININDRSLVIRNLTRFSAGKYVCKASNQEGEGISKPVRLKVKYAPVCVPGQKVRFGAARNEETRVTCQVDASPADVTYKWQFNNSVETLDLPYSMITSRGLASTVSYTPKTEMDYGWLLCRAVNQIGLMSTPCVYRIVPAGPPEPLQNCTVINQTSESLDVECAAGFDGGLPQHFVAELYDVQGHALVRNLTRPVPDFSITKLQPGLELKMELYAANVKGRSRGFTLDGFTLKMAEKRIANEADLPPEKGFSVTPILGILLGIVASLIIIAIGVVACMKNNSRRVQKPNNTHTDLVNSSFTIKDRGSAVGGAEEPSTIGHEEIGPGKLYDPDVIPNERDIEYDVVETTRMLNHLNSGMRKSNTLSPSVPYPKQTKYFPEDKGITYAELSLPRSGRAAKAPPRRSSPDSPVIYATIDHRRLPSVPTRDTVVRTALLNSDQESVV